MRAVPAMQTVRFSVRGVRHSIRLSAPGWIRKRSPGPHSSRRPNCVTAKVPEVTSSRENISEFSRSRQQPAVFSSSPPKTACSAHSPAGGSSAAYVKWWSGYFPIFSPNSLLPSAALKILIMP